jgi:CPA1 family monovalent cation:H+ antiporter
VDEGLFFVGLLGVAVVVTIAARKYEVPYTVALVAAGLVLGAVHPAVAPRLTHEGLYLVFLPGLIYEGAIHLDTPTFLANKRLILLLAVPGTVLGTVLTSAGLALLAPFLGVHGVRPVAWVVFGTLVAATDPTAVVALFRSLGLPKRLTTIVEGESLLNDAAAIVLFSIAVELAGGAHLTFGRGMIEFLRIASLGAFAGAAVATLVIFVARHVTDTMGRAALTMVAAYGSFLVAERLRLSGVVATLVAALMTAHAGVGGAPGTYDRAVIQSWWQFAAFALNSVVFLLVGFQAVQLGELAGLWAPVVAAYLIVVGTRFAVVGAGCVVLRQTSERVPAGWAQMLAWAGLRGPLSMVLALDLPDSLPEKRVLLDITSGVVVLSILVQGLSMPRFLRRGGAPQAGAGETAAACVRPSASARGVSSAFERTLAEWMRARCENACGKLPRRRSCCGSYSSDRSPRSFRSESSRSKRRSASLLRPE